VGVPVRVRVLVMVEHTRCVRNVPHGAMNGMQPGRMPRAGLMTVIKPPYAKP
jgi:hypothetical protein